MKITRRPKNPILPMDPKEQKILDELRRRREQAKEADQ